MTFKNLTTKQISQIANAYGFDPTERTVIANAQQASDLHGKPAGMRDGRPLVYWATDSYGNYDAINLLDGYLCQAASEARADARAHADFCRDAY